MIDQLNALATQYWHAWTGETSPSPALSWVMAANGGTFYYDNVSLFGLPAGTTQPLLVAKTCRLPAHNATLRTEYKQLTALWQRLGQAAAEIIPRPLALATNGHDIALVTNFLDGKPLLFASRSELWQDTACLIEVTTTAAQTLRFIHEQVATPTLPPGEPAVSFAEKFRLFDALFPLSQTEKDTLAHLAAVIDTHHAQSQAYTLLQGDFWHGNIIQGTEPGQLAIVDWQFAHWSPDASLDVYLYPLAGALSAVPYAAAEQRAQDAAQLVLQWRADFIPAYLQAYGHPQRYTLLPAREGFLLCCIELATRPVFAFKTPHPNDWMWYTLFVELQRLYFQE